MCHNSIFWKNREPFVGWMENFIYDTIYRKEFERAFSRFWNDTFDAEMAFQIDVKGVENLQLDPKSNGFGSLITFVFRQFEVLEEDDCTDQEVKDIVRKILLEIQTYSLESQIVFNSDPRPQN